jgi:hypothetical protein
MVTGSQEAAPCPLSWPKQGHLLDNQSTPLIQGELDACTRRIWNCCSLPDADERKRASAFRLSQGVALLLAVLIWTTAKHVAPAAPCTALVALTHSQADSESSMQEDPAAVMYKVQSLADI